MPFLDIAGGLTRVRILEGSLSHCLFILFPSFISLQVSKEAPLSSSQAGLAGSSQLYIMMFGFPAISEETVPLGRVAGRRGDEVRERERVSRAQGPGSVIGAMQRKQRGGR